MSADCTITSVSAMAMAVVVVVVDTKTTTRYEAEKTKTIVDTILTLAMMGGRGGFNVQIGYRTRTEDKLSHAVEA